MKEEMCPVVDEYDRLIRLAPKSECDNPPGLLHRTASLILYDNSGRILIQQRPEHLTLYPGKLTLSATGHVSRKASYIDSVRREAQEEIGITGLRPKRIGKIILDFPEHWTMTGVYSAVYDPQVHGPLKFDPEEVATIEFLTSDQIRECIDKFTPNSRATLERLKII